MTQQGTAAPRVETTNGWVEGTREGSVSVFRGIPYAAAPIGELRFAAPQSVAAWSETRLTKDFAAIAPQIRRSDGVFEGGADCLNLNVWTPSTEDSYRPVLVWIPGGGFHMGEGSDVRYDGTQLATRGDVVVVTLNYRLGAMGFLYLNGVADDVPWSANAGLLDQVAALEWVRDNISAFGGDPSQVTIFGESAGGMAVVDLMAMPKALGLFHGVIAQSGAADDVASADEASEMTGRVLGFLGLGAGEEHKILDVPTNDLLVAQQQCQMLYLEKRWGLSIRPVIDGTVMPMHPRAAIAEGRAANVPLLVGTNLDEWRAFADPPSFELDEAALRTRLKEALGAHAEEVLSAYAKCRPEASPSDLWFAIESDRNFRVPAIWLAEVHRRNQERTFSYLFTRPAVTKRLGSCHALDVPFVFGTLDKPGMPEFAGDSASAWALSSKVQDAWLAFAKTGNPGVESLPAWSAYDSTRRATMILDDPCGAVDAPFDAERQVWEFLPLRPKSPSTKDLNDAIASP